MALTFDAAGNLTGDGTNTYTWNARNQLVSIAGSVTATFAYDPLGRRTRRTVGGVTTRYLYDGVNAVQELDADGPTANLLTSLDVDETFVRTDANGSVGLLTDALGSVIALADASGAITTRYAYGPFGQVSASGAASGNAIQFSGRENDGTGLYYFRSRYYSPSLGRFISEDPMGIGAGQTNSYAYVNDDPADFTDAFGLEKQTSRFQQCMAANAEAFSITGAVDLALWGVGIDFDVNSYAAARMIGGNTLTTIAYSSLGENARAASMFAPEALADTVAPISYGRRTTEMMALNLAGKGGKPWVSRLPFETTIGPFAKAIGLGLSISERAIVDLEFTVGEMSYCAAY